MTSDPPPANHNTRLLILACSQRKRTTDEWLPAIERYDGPAFQVLRRHNQMAVSTCPTTLVLSAKHGLIQATTPIQYYDHRLNKRRALELQPLVKEQLECAVFARKPVTNDIMICAGSDYQVALGISEAGAVVDWQRILKQNKIRLTLTCGSIGKQIATLHDWLHKAPPALPTSINSANGISFKGQPIHHTLNEVLLLALEQAKQDQEGASRYESWYVSIGEMRVAPKWLLHQMTGVPVSQFKTQDALRVLTQLGVDIKRV